MKPFWRKLFECQTEVRDTLDHKAIAREVRELEKENIPSLRRYFEFSIKSRYEDAFASLVRQAKDILNDRDVPTKREFELALERLEQAQTALFQIQRSDIGEHSIARDLAYGNLLQARNRVIVMVYTPRMTQEEFEKEFGNES